MTIDNWVNVLKLITGAFIAWFIVVKVIMIDKNGFWND